MKSPLIYLGICLVVLAGNVIGQNYYYISDAGNFENGPYQILKVREDGLSKEVFITSNLAWPQDLLFLPPSQEVLISNFSSFSIDKFNAETGAFVHRFASNIAGPTRIKFGKDGYIYVLQWGGNGKVKRYQKDGTFIDDFTKTGVPQAIGIDWDEDGNLYISSYSGKYVEKFDTDGVSKGKFISSGLFGPTNIVFNDQGQLLVLDYLGGKIKLYDKNGVFIKNLVNGTNFCEGITLFDNGSFAIGANAGVQLYDKNGAYIKAVLLPGELQLKNPNAVVFHSENISSTDEKKIPYRISCHMDDQENLVIHDPEQMVQDIFVSNIHGISILEAKNEFPLGISLANYPAGLYLIMMVDNHGRQHCSKIVKSQ